MAGGSGSGGGGGSGSRRRQSSKLGGGSMSGGSAIPSLRVVPASSQDVYSKENGLLSLNLLLFEVCHYSARERGDATAEHTSLAHIVRRSGGPASLFTLCALYAALARRLGVFLQLVRLDLPEILRGRAPDFLLRLPASKDQDELYIDVLAEGRLRMPWDLGNFANQKLPADEMRSHIHELTPSEFCTHLVLELAEACEAADDSKEASFWRIQLEVLQGQIGLAEEELFHAEERKRRKDGGA